MVLCPFTTGRGPFINKPSDMKILPLLIGPVLLCTLSCHDEAERLCENLQKDLIDLNTPEVKAELDPWLLGLLPDPTDVDHIGHSDNLVYFQDQLSGICDLDSEWGCYACIETYPLQSEIIILVDSSGQVVERVLDILTPHDGIMTIRDVHLR
jgi:hypothetical protein